MRDSSGRDSRGKIISDKRNDTQVADVIDQV